LPPPAPARFRFVALGDTKHATRTLAAISRQALTLGPAFLTFAGDMVGHWSDRAMDTWRRAMDGGCGNGLFARTFTVRGNHEGGGRGYAEWRARVLPLARTAASRGARAFSSMPGREEEVYSFDYGGAHVVGLDALGDADTIDDAQLRWLDADLGAAERRGALHSFLFFHGPIYCVAGHCHCKRGICRKGTYRLLEVLGRHPSVSATFHGHEHVLAYTLVDSKRDARVARPFHQFVSGDAGAGPDTCKAGRHGFWLKAHGFVLVELRGAEAEASFYRLGGARPERVVRWRQPAVALPPPARQPQ